MLVKRNICNINENNKISKISIIVANEIIAIFFPHTMENQIVMLIQNKEILKNKKSHTLRVCSFYVPAVYCLRKGVHAYHLLLKMRPLLQLPLLACSLLIVLIPDFVYIICVMLFYSYLCCSFSLSWPQIIHLTNFTKGFCFFTINIFFRFLQPQFHFNSHVCINFSFCVTKTFTDKKSF